MDKGAFIVRWNLAIAELYSVLRAAQRGLAMLGSIDGHEEEKHSPSPQGSEASYQQTGRRNEGRRRKKALTEVFNVLRW